MERFDAIENQYRQAFGNYTVAPQYRPAAGNLDHLLLSFLQQSPVRFENRIPIDQPTIDLLSGILWFKLVGGSSQLFSKLILNAPGLEMQTTGKACGTMFKKGDGIFRCITCGLDDTCVLCTSCFKGINELTQSFKS